MQSTVKQRKQVSGRGTWCGVILSLVVACGGVAPAWAQQGNNPAVTPLSSEPDVNNINLTNGKTALDLPTIAIPAAPRLKFDRVQNSMPHLVATISGGTEATSSISVHGGRVTSESFVCTAADVCRTKSRNGAIIEGDMAYGSWYEMTEANTGARIYFDRVEYDSGLSVHPRKIQMYASSVTYPDGEVLTFTYETAAYYNWNRHRVTQVTSNTGYALTVTYAVSNVYQLGWGAPAQATIVNLSAPTIPLARLTYGSGTVTDLLGRTYACGDCANSVGTPVENTNTSITLPGEGAAAITIGGNTNVVTSVVKDGVTWTYAYNNFQVVTNTPSGYIYDRVTVTGPNGYSQVYNITPATGSKPNVIASSVDALGRTTSFDYDNYRLAKVTYPEGNYVVVAYDIYGNLSSRSTVAKPGSGLATITESSGIDATGCSQYRVLCFRPTYYIDGRGNRTDYAYDSKGRMIQRIDPADASGVRRATIMSYDGPSLNGPTLVRVCGIGTTCNTNAEIRTSYTYLGQTALPLTETRTDLATGATLTTTYEYDAAGRLIKEDGPLAGSADAKYYRYDAVGRKTWTIGAADANGVRQAVVVTYRNADDKVTRTDSGTIPDHLSGTLTLSTRQETEYDTRRNPVRVATLGTDGTTRQLVSDASFDDRGRQICATVRMNQAAFGSLPSDACTLGTQGSHGPDRISRNNYDAASQLSSIQKAFGTSLQQTYAAYTYWPNGKTKTLTDANGNVAQMNYDGHDRQSHWYFPAKVAIGQVNYSDYEQYGYDAAGNRTSLRKRDGSTLTYQYDNLNRMTLKVVPERAGLSSTHTRDVYYGYDLRGQPLYARFDGASGEGVTYAYDTFGRRLSETLVIDGVSRTLWSGYDAAGMRTSLQHPDGNVVNYYRDSRSRLYYAGLNGSGHLFYPNYLADGSVAAVYRLQVSPYSWGWSDAVNGFGYDSVGRLSTLTTGLAGASYDSSTTFTRNPASQIASTTRDNDVYAWTGSTNVDRNYTANGLNQYTAAGSASFGYDANGNLTSDGTNSYLYDIENRMVSRSGTGSAGLRYDPLGRLYEVAGASGTTRFLYDGDALIAEYDSAGNLLRRYVHGAAEGADDPMVWFEGPGVSDSARRYLFADERGSIVAVTDANGNALAINSYDEYGILGAGNQGRFQYTGQAWIPELGLFYYKARMYSPTLGRFMQTDPIGYEDQVNLYGYVGNDPVNAVDPTGMVAKSEGSSNTCTITGAGSACSGNYPGSSGSAVGMTTEGVVKAGKDAVSAAVNAGARAVETASNILTNINEIGQDMLDTPSDLASQAVQDATDKVHGNSARSQRYTEVYELRDMKGKVLKIGITSSPPTRYTQAYLREHGAIYVRVHGYSNRYSAIVHENIALEHYRFRNLSLPPLNKTTR